VKVGEGATETSVFQVCKGQREGEGAREVEVKGPTEKPVVIS